MMRREAIPRRRPPSRDSRRTILIYCGAARTEPDYFNGLKSSLRTPAVTVKVRQEGVDPVRLVRIAAGYRDRRPGVFDQVWCVVDVDQFDLPSAIAEARRLGIRLAVSNPCFELWLLLHHADCRGHCSGYPDVAARLSRHVPGYDKTRLNFANYAPGLDDAAERARSMEPTGSDHACNPSTNVWQLIDSIREQR
jgi:hypothetical protein